MDMGKFKIVAVDDDPFICDTLAISLKGEYEINTFLSGKDTLAYLKDNVVDLILLDYEMPEMTGYEVLMGIHDSKNKQNNSVPVIFLTGVVNERMEVEMRARGASDYIRKPIDMAKLRECIEKHLKK
jgi:response regulator RpfG family c-di-GMP phosphodiesterase